MKKKFILGAAMAAAMLLHGWGMAAEGNPSCVLMRFTDDTRYDRVESAPTLSDLVLEKLLNSGKFNFKETKVIDQDMDKMLYDEKNAMFQNQIAISIYNVFSAIYFQFLYYNCL